jgi:uncharacterized protein (TIGR04168 family)
MRDGSAQIAVVGDLHSSWDDDDVAYFNASRYNLVLFTGDLGASTRKDGLRIAKSISRIRRDVLIMPGNNDVPQYGTLSAELKYRRGLRNLLDDSEPPAAPSAGEPRVQLCGYSSHSYTLGDAAVTVIAGRPFSFGGEKLWFEEELAREFGVRSLAESTARIVALALAAPTRELIFLSHNGPSGFGSAASAPWGKDFEPGGGDWGDPDLAAAVAQVLNSDKRVLAVIGGHMHSPIRGGQPRTLRVERDGVLYLNPARVPRIVESASGVTRHHVALGLPGSGAGGLRVEELFVE